MLWNFSQLLGRLAQKQPLLLVLENLQWADESSLELLHFVARHANTQRVLVIGTYNLTERDSNPALKSAEQSLIRIGAAGRIELSAFSVTQVSELIQRSFEVAPSVVEKFSTLVYGWTRGNPFFVEEVLKALIERGSVRRESGRWHRCDMDQLLIPQSVKEAIGNRLDRVSQNCNDVLRVCAILGKVFTFDELSAAAEQNEDALLDALDEASGAQLIVAGSDDSFSFTHDKIREVLYEELNPIRRRRLHRHVAEGLERNCTRSQCAVE
jgi:predicted ATPase